VSDMAAGLASGHNLRLVNQDEPDGANDDLPVEVRIVENPDGDNPITDKDGNVLRVEHSDGSITISTDGGFINGEDEDLGPPKWFDNLVGRINEMELGIIADDLLRGIDDDIQSRQDWIDQRADAMKMLGLKLETPNAGDSADGAAVEGMSRVRHPVMLEAVLQYQANFRGEMLPVDGPCKIADDDNNGSNERDELADDYENDFNHFLTTVATEYYPDTDRMALEQGFSGLGIKKVYFCPMRNRPVSERVDTEDFIVNNSATDIGNTIRATHRMMQRPSVVRRMQILGAYADVDLGDPNPPKPDALKNEKKEQQGIATTTFRPEDRDREIYECYCEYDIQGFEHKWKGKPSGLPVPWRITIDVSSRKVMSIVRDYDEPEGDDELPMSNVSQTFIDYTFVPGFGFYPIGLLHIMGNMTNAATAAWREMLDMGMFANFPGFLYAKTAGRQNSLIFRVPPGGGAPIDTGGQPINQAVMPLPYKTDGMAALFQLQQDIVSAAQRAGQSGQVQVAEGRADIPVGTMLAMVEQAQKLLSAVHKRNHAAQARELQAIARQFRLHPGSFWQCNKKPARKWDQKTFEKAVNDCLLVPRSDPNTASHLQRLIKLAALDAVSAANPGVLDPIVKVKAQLRGLGYSNPDSMMMPESALRKPPPELELEQKKLANETKKADATMLTAQTGAKKAESETGLATGKLQLEHQNTQIKAASEQIKGGLAARKQDADEEAGTLDAAIQLTDVAERLSVHPDSAALVAPLLKPTYEAVVEKQQEHRAKKAQGLGMQMPPGGMG